MDEIKDHLKDISEIRGLMERSSKFLSLSGLSGVSAGICALIGAAIAWSKLGGYYIPGLRGELSLDFMLFFLLDAGIVLVAALGTAIFFSTRMARKKGYPVWNGTARQMILSMMIPLGAGGVFALIQLSHGVFGWLAATTLIFYGLALLNGSKYTLPEIRLLGLSEIFLGLICAYFIGYGFIFWILGFGVLHIVYGIVMYLKYEK